MRTLMKGNYLTGGALGRFSPPDEVAFTVARGEGPWIWSTDGRRYADYLMGAGPMVLGHAHPRVVSAIAEQASKGTHYYLMNEPAHELAARICQLVPCAASVRYCADGSEANFYALTRLREALRVFGPVFFQGYGQTEAPATILFLSQEDHLTADDKRLESAGTPYPGINVKLLDDSCKPVSPGEVGEIGLRGPLVMSGYWKKPELTEDTLRGGWLHTGDLAYQDQQGYFFIVDRKKDMIISGGFNVYPNEVENALTQHPSVASAAVIGIPDAKWGEAVKAFVVLRPGQNVSSDELIAFTKELKGPVKTPKSVELVETLPLTNLGKVDKKALRAPYWKDAARQVNG
ncbi:aminotransferase class III-fold pyridoxal phosphate-dependent enzyme [Bradyrhizobium sp. DASA03007]|uniref:aminotransferase class III-fold pyridoxal phosphate-dependent enzyme n=1 Tax=unclassified Bradyrhizobium TaxID=2631580 RepID=UPI003F7116D0